MELFKRVSVFLVAPFALLMYEKSAFFQASPPPARKMLNLGY